MANQDVSKSWFIVFNNPRQHGYLGEPHEILETLKQQWIEDFTTRTGAWLYCISADGLEHVHMVCEDTRAMRFSIVKKTYGTAHIEPTMGNKKQAEDYVDKVGKWEEKGEIVVCKVLFGEIKGAQGQRTEFKAMMDLINEGVTPRQILWEHMDWRKYEKYIRDAFYEKNNRETPFLREIKIIWHVGATSTGKSYVMQKLVENKDFGEDSFYLYNDYEGGGLDFYNGEKILILDEFRGQLKYSILLSMLQGYKSQFHARYTNIFGLWNTVHITSVMPPELCYAKMVSDNQDIDTIGQLMRRITTIVYHYKDSNGNYLEFECPIKDYKDYKSLVNSANNKEIVEFEYVQDELPFL